MRLELIWGVTLGLLATWGCTTPVLAPIEWEELDPQVVAHQFQNPTGEVTPETVVMLAQQFLQLADDLEAVGHAVSHLINAMDTSETKEGPLAVKRGGLSLDGTSAFLKVSCPGADLNVPDLSFGSGLIRVDSPSLADIKGGADQLTGDLLVTFSACLVETKELLGQSVAIYDKNNADITMRLAVEVVSLVDTATLDQLFRYGSGVLQVMLVDEAGKSYVVSTELNSDMQEIEVKGTNGVFSCGLNAEPLGCMDNDGIEFSFAL